MYLAKIVPMKKPSSMHEAKTHLSRLVERACAGENVIISRGKVPVVRLVPLKAAAPRRRFGAMRGRARVSKVFFEPLPGEELDGWGR